MISTDVNTIRVSGERRKGGGEMKGKIRGLGRVLGCFIKQGEAEIRGGQDLKFDSREL